MTNIALIYDVCKTLTKGYHPDALFIHRKWERSKIDEFWKTVGEEQNKISAMGMSSKDVLWIDMLLEEFPDLSIDELKKASANVDDMLFEGLPEYFETIKKDNPEYAISHNLVSVGLSDLLSNSCLGKYVDKIFGFVFRLRKNGSLGIAGTTSSAEKVNAIVNISYGKYGPSGQYDIKNPNSDDKRFEFPLCNAVYLGDGMTDVPSLRYIYRYGGLGLIVFHPDKNPAVQNNNYKKAKKLESSVGEKCIFPADYRKGSGLYQKIDEFIKSR